MRLTRRMADAGLTARLLAAFALVIVLGGATAWAVWSIVGPSLFADHMARFTDVTSSVLEHAQLAFEEAAAISISIALVAALAVAIVASLLIARRIQRALAPLTDAASRVAAGERGVSVPAPGLGPQIDNLAATFSAMARDLDGADKTRTRLLADLAHEMRTPVAVLSAYLEAIADGVQQPSQETLGVLRDQTRRLDRLTQDIALVTSLEDGRLRLQSADIDLGSVAAAAVDAAAIDYARDEVALDFDPRSPARVRGDADRIGQVLSNLLDNARRHTPAGGHVVVRVTASAGQSEISVTDDGDGIPAIDIDHVFDRFYRVDQARDRARGGSGIGLSIARSIAQAHGGDLSASSPGAGGGSTFVLRLPESGPPGADAAGTS